MKIEDPELAAVLFLGNHPGWSWADLAATPDRVVEALKVLDRERATNARRG